MPTYEYLCDKCGHEFEKFQPMADKPLKTCPKELCGLKSWGKGRVRKLIGAGAGLLFKGSGFYITDYRSDGYKAAAKKESGTASGAENKGAGGGDPKAPTAKSEAKSTSKPAKEAK